MWCLILTATGVQGEAYNPAHVEVETYGTKHEAEAALRKMYCDKIAALSAELEYSAFDASMGEARVFGELAVCVMAIRRMPEQRV